MNKYTLCGICLSFFVMLQSINPSSTKVISGSTAKYIAQEIDRDTSVRILWQADRKLTWDDFKGTPDKRSRFQAMTSVFVAYKNEYTDREYKITIQCLFDKDRSWSKSKGEDSEELLKHEQLHFDIAELIARKMRKEIAALPAAEWKKTAHAIEGIYKKYYGTDFNNMSTKYDEETNHGIIKNKQAVWSQKIATELKKLDKHAATEVILKMVKSK